MVELELELQVDVEWVGMEVGVTERWTGVSGCLSAPWSLCTSITV